MLPFKLLEKPSDSPNKSIKQRSIKAKVGQSTCRRRVSN